VGVRLAQSRAILTSFFLIAWLSAPGPRAASAQNAPGRAPGDPVVLLNEGAGGTLENRSIAATWKIRDGRLGPVTIRDKQPPAGAANASLTLDEPFSIELKGAGVVRASDLRVTGSATVERLTPNPAASRAADRLAGVRLNGPSRCARVRTTSGRR